MVITFLRRGGGVGGGVGVFALLFTKPLAHNTAQAAFHGRKETEETTRTAANRKLLHTP